MVDRNVNTNEPALISDGVGVYTAFKVCLLGLKLPLPPTHSALLLVALPASCTAELLEHIVWSTPAFTTGAAPIVNNTLSETELQIPLFVEVNVKLTVPFAISVAVGEYIPVNASLAGLIEPKPLLQIPVPTP